MTGSKSTESKILESLSRIEARLSSIEETQNTIAGDLRDVALRTTLIEKRIAIMQDAIDKLAKVSQ